MTARARRIVAFGGGGFSMEAGNPLLDAYTLDVAGGARRVARARARRHPARVLGGGRRALRAERRIAVLVRRRADGLPRRELHDSRASGCCPFSNAVHYDSENRRRPAYHAAVAAGMPAGYAADDGAALHFVGTELGRVVTSRPQARAYHMAVAGRAIETPLEARYLGVADPVVVLA